MLGTVLLRLGHALKKPVAAHGSACSLFGARQNDRWAAESLQYHVTLCLAAEIVLPWEATFYNMYLEATETCSQRVLLQDSIPYSRELHLPSETSETKPPVRVDLGLHYPIVRGAAGDVYKVISRGSRSILRRYWGLELTIMHP